MQVWNMLSYGLSMRLLILVELRCNYSGRRLQSSDRLTLLLEKHWIIFLEYLLSLDLLCIVSEQVT